MPEPIRISIVEDDVALRESITLYLNATRGLQCISGFTTAEQALAHLPSERPDVVLMDINLGGTNGIECARQLKAICPAMQILMLTVFDDTDRIFEALRAGASGYLLKRVAPARLLEAIREVFLGGSPMSAPIARKVVESFRRTTAPGSGETLLSTREQQVLDRLARGCTYKIIADELGVSVDTIRTYIRRIYEKLHVSSRTEAVARYLTRDQAKSP